MQYILEELNIPILSSKSTDLITPTKSQEQYIENIQVKQLQTILSEEDLYRIEFISNIGDPIVSKNLSALLSFIQDLKLDLTITNIEKGDKKYELNILLSEEDSKENLDKIIEMVGLVSYVPVYVSFDYSDYIERDNLGSIITGVESIIRAVTEQVLNISVEYVSEISLDNNIINLYPNTRENLVYTNSSYQGMITNLCNVDHLAGYQFLSTDYLTGYVVEKWLSEKQYSKQELNIIYLNTDPIDGKGRIISLIYIGGNTETENMYTDIKNRLNDYINTLRLDGYFIYNIGLYNLEDLEIIKNIADMYDIEYILSLIHI